MDQKTLTIKLYLKILRGTAATDFTVSDNYEEKGKLQPRNKSSKVSTFTTHNEDNNNFKKSWKNENTLITTNKSTISLHIAAHENSNEAAASGLFDDENIEGFKLGKLRSIKTSEHCFTDRLMNPFEFPRQQNENQRKEPEVMQFKTSQRTLGSQPPTTSEQIEINGEQMPPGAGAAEMSSKPTKFGLVLSKNAPASTTRLPVASVFGDEDDSDNEIANEKDADKKFHMKYGSNKTRDQRAVEEALAADPDVYEYDSIHDDLVSKRNAKTEEQKEADKNREPKYAHKIVLATQKRAMEKLMVDERKQAKEREAEGEEFKDKDAFVTGAYKKQIEERERIRKELEEQDRMDGRLKIEDQHFWQANLNRRLLDDLTDDKPVIKKEIIVENKLEQEKKLFQELKPGLNQPKSLTKPKQSPTPESSRSSRRDRDRDDVHHRKRRRSDERRRQHQRSTSKDKARYRRRHDSSASSRSPSPRSKENNDDVKKHKMHPEKQQSDKEILYERLEKIKEILKQRNSESEIFMARQRYLQRKQNGEIRAPI